MFFFNFGATFLDFGATILDFGATVPTLFEFGARVHCVLSPIYLPLGEDTAQSSQTQNSKRGGGVQLFAPYHYKPKFLHKNVFFLNFGACFLDFVATASSRS